MLNLDCYMNHSIKVRVLGKEIDVLEPSYAMIMQVDELEKDLTPENEHKKRLQTVKLFLEHNKQGEEFAEEDLENLPLEAIRRLIAEVSVMRYEADTNPNFKSQSQAEK